MSSRLATELLPCEVLFDLFDGPSGTASIGRLLAGAEFGRQVFLRRTSYLGAEELAREVTASGLVAHPSLIKVLGLATLDGVLHVASEYIVGASLLQLSSATRQRPDVLETKVGLKIIHDALRASATARQLLKQTSDWWVPRTIFSDTVWVAEYGETLLTEVGVSRLLHGPERRSGPAMDPHKTDADADVAAAGAELRRLLTNERGELVVPLPLEQVVASIIARAENPREPERFRDAEEMSQAIAELPPGCIATEGEVGFAIRTLMGPILESQRAKLGLSVGHDTDRPSDDATRVFNAKQLVQESERITARPPAIPMLAGKATSASAEPQLPPDQNYDTTRLLFVEQAPSAASHRDDEMTQIFMPVFEEPAKPRAMRAGAAPVDSIRMLPDPGPLPNRHPPLARRAERRASRSEPDWWKATALLLAVLLVLVVSFVALR